MDTRLAPLDTTKTDSYMWKYCDNLGAMSQPICVNLVYMGEFVLSYLLNPTTYGHERLFAPLDTTKMEVYKDMWKYIDNSISFGAKSS